MTMSSREMILARLRQSAPSPASAGASLQETGQMLMDYYQQHTPRTSPGERIHQFAAALEAAHAEVDICNEPDWAGKLAEKLAQNGIRRLLLNKALPALQVLLPLLPVSCSVTGYDQPIETWKQSLFDDIDAGLTLARSGIASTGTLILAPDSGTPRTVSLVPPLHIALVYASTLHADMYSAQQAERWSLGMPANLVMVSGPSKTSDIQQTLAYGAHGPRRMWVIVIDDLQTGEAT